MANSISLILDPRIAVVESAESVEVAGSAWEELAEWLADERAHLGAATYLHVATIYQELLGGDFQVPGSLRVSALRCLGRLLGKGPLGSATESAGRVVPSCTGDPSLALLLAQDLASIGGSITVALGTKRSCWDQDVTQISLDPPPPSQVSLHFSPGLPTLEDERAARHAMYSGLQVVIIGGQVESRVVDILSRELGLAQEAIRWIPSELHKKPRNLEAVVRGLASSSGVVVCLTGRVAHSTSGQAKLATAKFGVPYIEIESAARLMDAIQSAGLS